MSQSDILLAHLKIYGHITTMEAFQRYGITCAGQRMSTLKRLHPIKVEMIYNGKAKYAKYSLDAVNH